MQHQPPNPDHCRTEKQQLTADLLEAVAQQGRALAGLLSCQADLLCREEDSGEIPPASALEVHGGKAFDREGRVRRMVTAVCMLEILQQMKLELFSPQAKPLPPCAAVKEEEQIRRLLAG